MNHQGVKPVLILDSGLGGITIFDAVQQAMPWQPLVYCFDNAFFPYGQRTPQEVVTRIHACIEALIQLHAPKAIIIACNTASTLVLPSLRKRFVSIAIIGVVPAIKIAAAQSKNRCIGLLATTGTVKRDYTKTLLLKYAATCQTVLVGSNTLAQKAEALIRGYPISQSCIREVLLPFLEHTPIPDNIVLGCTHFPFLMSYLAEAMAPNAVHWIDSCTAIAKRLRSLVAIHPPTTLYCPYHLSYATSLEVFPAPLRRFFLKRGLQPPKLLQPLFDCIEHYDHAAPSH